VADSSTYKKRQRIEPRQRMSAIAIEDISDLGLANQAEDIFTAITQQDCVIGGMQISHTTGSSFQVEPGAIVVGGEILKMPAASPLGAQDPIVSGTDKRIDLVYLDTSTLTYLDTPADGATVTRLSLTTVTNVPSEAVGTGDDTTETFSLANDGVDPETLRVYLDGSQEFGGYTFSSDPGGSGDEIIFDTAPAAGTAITASYDYLDGGEESTTTVTTRYNRTPTPQIRKGTEAASPTAPALGANEVFLGLIYYPAGWSSGDPTGAVDGAFIYDTKVFLVARDAANTNSYGSAWSGDIAQPHNPADQPVRISDAVRNIGVVRHGCRVRYIDTDTIAIGPGWLNNHGISCRVFEDIEHTVTASDGVGWYYIYAKVAVPSGGSGLPFTIVESSNAPNSLGQETSAPLTNAGTFYLGAIYVASTGPVVVREFSTDDDGWVYWHGVSSLAVPAVPGGAPYDIDVSAWCPATSKKIDVSVSATLVATAIDQHGRVDIASNKDGSTLGNLPDLAIHVISAGSGSYIVTQRGIIRVETDSAVRKIYGAEVLTSGTSITGLVNVAGYYDSFYSVNESGAVLTH